MTIARNCPACGQPLKAERLGVFMPLVKAALVDAIAAAGEYGTTTEEMQRLAIWRERRQPSPVTVRAHIWQINELLDETDWRIGRSDRRYVLIHTTPFHVKQDRRDHGIAE